MTRNERVGVNIASVSIKPHRTGLRLLRALEVLNSLGQASNLTLARELDLSPPTVYRLLQTLLVEGYVSKNSASKLYRPAGRVRGLSIGFDEAASIADCARPLLAKLGDELLWPVAIASVVGTAMVVHETTDARSPLTIRPVLPGRRVSMLDTASGRVFLAFCPQEQRDTLLDLLALSDDPRDAAARLSFLMSVPIIGGAVVFKLAQLWRDGIPEGLAVPMLVGIVSAGISGWVAMWSMIRLVRTKSFSPYVVYRVAFGAAILLLVATNFR